ncbi:hypothetical protein [Streptomyces benahoarensis]|uniref:Uncharacterized protein n=1 Tax=Streptomyces benahoarensis TaxID=2595054 RepID=A0A553YH35_9ACTN|nr:hypothetical protein [Streptomyces benahoarensis]TSB24570.1 hypothetical protein FNJ62_14035 [Streptomyces benahoarensis]TSB28373.1 hypothetical protein FNZ23_26530 [Streptomyces benahoarensis]
MRNKAMSVMIACALTGVAGGTAQAASSPGESSGEGNAISARSTAAADPQVQAGADEICAVIGIGSGAAGLTKALAKGASWVGIGASIGCYAYTKAKQATPAQKRAAMLASYKKYQAMSALKKLDALGYYCRKEGGGGGGGTDVAPTNSASVGTMAGWRTITMKGVKYSCTATRD